VFCARAVFAAAAGVNRRTLARDFWLVFSLFVCSVSRLVPRLPTYHSRYFLCSIGPRHSRVYILCISVI